MTFSETKRRTDDKLTGARTRLFDQDNQDDKSLMNAINSAISELTKLYHEDVDKENNNASMLNNVIVSLKVNLTLLNYLLLNNLLIF